MATSSTPTAVLSSNLTNAMAPSNISALQTEAFNPNTAEIDQVSTPELCKLINDEDALVAPAVEKCIPAISDAIDALAPRIARGGKLVYVGAGTSGRLGVVDASEIPPTFSAPYEQFVGLMAGGDAAMRKAQEGAEDSPSAAVRDLETLKLDRELDSVIGIAASGRTPYVLGALAYAKKLGCVTIGLACADPCAMNSGDAELVDYMISPLPGPEAVMGSTRLKAGTATKLVLNMLSTGVMIKIGKTYGNMMVDLQASNLKLKQRSRNIIRKLLGPSRSLTDAEIDDLLASCHGSVKLSLATLALGSTPEYAHKMLEGPAGGKLHAVLQNAAAKMSDTKSDYISNPGRVAAREERRVVMYIDGGGSKCAAVVVNSDGEIGKGEAGPCNVTDVGHATALASIRLAAQRALDSLVDSYRGSRSLNLADADFEAVWIGLAGYDRPEVAATLDPALSKLFNISGSGKLRVSNDIDVLATAAGPSSNGSNEGTDSAVVLIAGTGSIAKRYKRESNGKYICDGRSGGWGHLLGDDGGGFDLGRQAIRTALSAFDESRVRHAASSYEELAQITGELPRLPKMVVQHFCPPGTSSYDVLSNILMGNSSVGTDSEKKSGGYADTKSRIARIGQLVMQVAGDHGETDAETILASGVSGLVRTVKPLISNSFDPGKSTLVLSGSLLTSDYHKYRTALLSGLLQAGISFGDVRIVQKPAELGARALADSFLGLELVQDAQLSMEN